MNSSVLSAFPTGAPKDGAMGLHADSSMGALLLDSGKLTPESAERVLRMQKDLGIRFGEAAVRLGLVSEDDIQQVLARQFSSPYLQKGQAGLSPKLIAAYEPFSQQVEALRAIRSQLMLRWFARGRRALAIVGALLLVGSFAVAATGKPGTLYLDYFNSTQALHYLLAAGIALLALPRLSAQADASAPPA